MILTDDADFQVSLRNAFAKADPDSVAFTAPSGSTVSLKAGAYIELAGLGYVFAADTAVQMPALTPGTDYAIYPCNDGTLRADANFSAPTGFTAATSRKIGGFHYAPGSNALAQAGGDAVAWAGRQQDGKGANRAPATGAAHRAPPPLLCFCPLPRLLTRIGPVFPIQFRGLRRAR